MKHPTVRILFFFLRLIFYPLDTQNSRGSWKVSDYECSAEVREVPFSAAVSRVLLKMSGSYLTLYRHSLISLRPLPGSW